MDVHSRVDSLQEHAEEQLKASRPLLLPLGLPQHAEHDRPRVFLSGEIASSLSASSVQVCTCPEISNVQHRKKQKNKNQKVGRIYA